MQQLGKPKGKERIIVAIDASSPVWALQLVKTLRPHVGLFKFGFEMMQAMLVTMLRREVQFDTWMEQILLYRALFFAAEGRVFWDGKFHDISNTVDGACRNAAMLDIQMLNVHCSGGRKMMKKAAEATRDVFQQGKGTPLILGVTLLTSLAYDDLVELGFADVLDIADAEELERLRAEKLNDIAIHHLARLAEESRLDGIICSPKELSEVRRVCSPDFITVTPGVRPAGSAVNDQKRVMTPGEAVKAGATYLVIGRPITGAENPADAAQSIASEIEEAERNM